MNVSVEKLGDIAVMAVSGQLNSANAAAAEATLLGRVDSGERRCVLDFSALDYISSAGLRVVLLLAKRLKQTQGSLVLCGLQPHVREVFDISGFLAILQVADTRDQALAIVQE